jgi:hypothetical protein
LKWLWLRSLGLPIRGGTYVVAAVGTHRGLPYIRLKGFSTVWFCALLFRPVTDPKIEADLALFRPLLDVAHPPIPEPSPLEPANAGSANHGEYNAYV